MTKTAALHQFFSSFGLSAYEESSAYSLAMAGTAPSYPYLTYEVVTDSFGEYSAPLNFSIWYRSNSWVQANAKAQTIARTIGQFTKLDVDGGYILITRSSPFAQNMGDDSDDMVKRVLFSINVSFYTNN